MLRLFSVNKLFRDIAGVGRPIGYSVIIHGHVTVSNWAKSEMKEFDSLLDSIGGFGKYQFLLMIPLFYYQVPAGLNTIAPVFLSYEPEFR